MGLKFPFLSNTPPSGALCMQVSTTELHLSPLALFLFGRGGVGGWGVTGLLVSFPGWPGTLSSCLCLSVGITGMCRHDGLGSECLFLTV